MRIAAALSILMVVGCGSGHGAAGPSGPALPDGGSDTPAPTGGLSIEGDHLTADGRSEARIVLTVRDGSGAPVPNQRVQLSALGSGSHLQAAAGTTDGSGSFTTTLSSTRAETKIVVAHAAQNRYAKDVAFVPGPPDASASNLSSSALRVASDGITPAVVTLHIADANGNPVSGVGAVLTTGGGTLAPARDETDGRGDFRSTLTSAVAGQIAITAVAGQLSFALSVTFATDAPSVVTSSFTGPEGPVAVGDPAPVLLTLRDFAGNAVAGIPVQFHASGGGTSFSPAVGTTGADGTLASLVSSTLADQKHLSATVDGLTIGAEVAFTGPPWQRLQTGFWGGSVQAVAFDPVLKDVAYAGPASGLYRSMDGGASWTETSLNATGYVNAILIDPATGDIFASDERSGWVSHDGAQTWQALAGGTIATGMALSQGVLYVSYLNDGVYKSTDGGRSLTLLGASPANALRGVVADPVDPNVLYAWSTVTGVSASTDGGQHWSSASSLDATGLSALAIDPARPLRLYAAVARRGILLSDDGGAHWRVAIGSLDVPYQSSIYVDPGNPSRVFAAMGVRIWRSDDAAKSWTAIDGTGFDAPATVYGLAVDPGDPDHLLAGGFGYLSQGIFESSDAGGSWRFSSQGLDRAPIAAFAPDPFDRDGALASVGGLLIRTADGGVTWTSIHAGLPPTQVLSIAGDPGARDSFYVTVLNDGIWKTTDGGSSWNRVTVGELDFFPFGLTILRTSPPTVFAADARATNRAYRSADGGATWTVVPAPAGVEKIAGCDSHPESLYAAGPGGVFVSSDSGATWTRVHGPLQDGDFVSSLVIDPSDSATAYLATYKDGIERTRDGGANWTQISPLFAPWAWSSGTVALDPANPANVYAVILNRPYASVDRGDSWSLADQGIPSQAALDSLTVSPADPSLLFGSGWYSRGVYRSPTAGQ